MHTFHVYTHRTGFTVRDGAGRGSDAGGGTVDSWLPLPPRPHPMDALQLYFRYQCRPDAMATPVLPRITTCPPA